MEESRGTYWPDAGAGPIWAGFHAHRLPDLCGGPADDGVARDQQGGKRSCQPGHFDLGAAVFSHAGAVLALSVGERAL